MRILSLLCACALLLFAPNLVEARPVHYQPEIYSLDYPKLPAGEVAFINGVTHKPYRAQRCSKILAKLSGGYNVYTIYNPTEGLLSDLRECYFELFKFHKTPPIGKLHEKWDSFFAQARDEECFLQFCHSQGAIQVRNALLNYSPLLRKRIIVVAIAPAAYITDDICGRAYHYVSRRDIVTKFDRKGRKACKDTIVMLSPHPQAAFFDHHFLSPTYREAIHTHLRDYLIYGAKLHND